MRLWSIHPVYLDAIGLVALWRESLLAQKVLQGNTKGYKNHPQLNRFKDTIDPLGAIAGYLQNVLVEADSRGYKFDCTKIIKTRCKGKIPVTNGQVDYEFKHLLEKLKKRNPQLYAQLKGIEIIKVHPTFKKIDGDIADWEIVSQ